MPPMPIHRYPRDVAPPDNTSDSSKPNTGLIAALVTCGAVILFLSIVLVVPMLRRRRQRSAPPPATVEEFLGKDSTFERSNPNDIAAILDHLSYLPQNDGSQPPLPSPKRRSLLLGRRLSSQRPSSIIGPPPNSNRFSGQHRPVSAYRRDSGAWDSYYEKEDQLDAQLSVPGDMRDHPPLDEYAYEHAYVPATAPAVSTGFNGTQPLRVRSRNSYLRQPRRQPRTRDVTSPQSDYSDSDSEDEYSRAHGYRPHTANIPGGKENKRRSVNELIKSRFSFSRDSPQRDSFSLAAAPRPRNRAPPPTPNKHGRTPLDAVPEMPDSSIAVGFALPDSPGDVVVVTPTDEKSAPSGRPHPDSQESFRQVPLTPRSVALPRTPRTPGSPLKEVFTASPPRTPLREVLTPRTPRPRRDPISPI